VLRWHTLLFQPLTLPLFPYPSCILRFARDPGPSPGLLPRRSPVFVFFATIFPHLDEKPSIDHIVVKLTGILLYFAVKIWQFLCCCCVLCLCKRRSFQDFFFETNFQFKRKETQRKFDIVYFEFKSAWLPSVPQYMVHADPIPHSFWCFCGPSFPPYGGVADRQPSPHTQSHARANLWSIEQQKLAISQGLICWILIYISRPHLYFFQLSHFYEGVPVRRRACQKEVFIGASAVVELD